MPACLMSSDSATPPPVVKDCGTGTVGVTTSPVTDSTVTLALLAPSVSVSVSIVPATMPAGLSTVNVPAPSSTSADSRVVAQPATKPHDTNTVPPNGCPMFSDPDPVVPAAVSVTRTRVYS